MGQAREYDGRRGIVGADPAGQGRAGPSPGMTASHRLTDVAPPPFRIFAAGLLFLFNVLS